MFKTKAAEMIGKAKAALILEQPFFASIICSLPMIENNDIPTMATNGKKFYYNTTFVEGLKADELKFVLCHEVGHCIFQHMFRKGTRNHRKWNIAGDYVINDLLVNEKIGTMPANGLLNPQLVIAGGGTTEGVYDLLPESQAGDGGGFGQPGEPGEPLDDCMDPGGSQADQTQAEAEMKVMLSQAAAAAKMCGKLSANMERFVGSALKPKVDWRDVLRRFMNARAKVDLTYARPKRRFLADDIYLPTMSGCAMGEIVIAVDCSGSIGQAELDEFAAEMIAIKEDVRPSAVHVVYFDSRVCHYDKFDQDDELHVEPHGGGGTAFSPIFRYVDEMGIEPVCCVVLTDLYCSDFGPPTYYPTLWVTTAATEAPWGEVVEMNPKGL